jgi:hypothetical protein
LVRSCEGYCTGTWSGQTEPANRKISHGNCIVPVKNPAMDTRDHQPLRRHEAGRLNPLQTVRLRAGGFAAQTDFAATLQETAGFLEI